MTEQEYQEVMDSFLKGMEDETKPKNKKPLEINSNDSEFLELIETGLDL